MNWKALFIGLGAMILSLPIILPLYEFLYNFILDIFSYTFITENDDLWIPIIIVIMYWIIIFITNLVLDKNRDKFYLLKRGIWLLIGLAIGVYLTIIVAASFGSYLGLYN